MIEWKKYDRDNPPKTARNYLASDGYSVGIGFLRERGGIGRPFYVEWTFPTESYLSDANVNQHIISHYSEINIPKEENK